MAFPESWLNELLAKNDIVSVVSSYVELKPKGRRLWGKCPLHGEKTPSFSVSKDKQLFYCFGCHAGGTVIQFIMDMERLPFPEAVRFLADRVGMQIPETLDDGKLQREKAYRDRLRSACQAAARFYMETLLSPEGKAAQIYLQKRGLDSGCVKRFGIGFARDGWDNLKNHLMDGGFTQQELLDAGLLVKNEQKGSVYDAYRNRIIFPIIGVSGKVIGFGARVMDGGTPKYINTGDTLIYNKRNNLYGLYLQKGGKLSDLIMVEGYMDVIGLYQAGVTNAVASLGTALTTQQARLLKRYVETVYIAYDGDAAGQNAMIRGLDILTAEGLTVRVIVFPNDQDPDEFVRAEGKEAFDQLKDQALSLSGFKLESMARSFHLEKENEREQYAMKACSFIASLQPIERDRYYLQVAKKTGYPVDALKAQTGTGVTMEQTPLHSGTPVWKNRKNTGLPEETERTRAEASILTAMLSNREAADETVSCGGMDLLEGPYRKMAEEAIGSWLRGEAPNPAAIVAGMEREDADRLSSVWKDDAPVQQAGRTVKDCIRCIRRYDLARQIQELTQSLSVPQLDEAERNQKLMERQKLERERRGI